MSNAQNIILDASAYREPASGVQLSVRHQAEALTASLPDGRVGVLSRDGLGGAAALSIPALTHHPVWRAAWQQLLLPKLLQRQDATVLHALAYTAPLHCPVPLVLNVHDIIALEYPHLCAWANRWHYQLLLPGSIRRADCCIVSTRDVADRLMRRFQLPSKRLEVIPLGVDFERFSTPSPLATVQGNALPERYFLFVGNIEPKKNLGTLLAAYDRCANACQAELWVAGRAGWKCAEEVRALQQWTGSGRVRWLGRVNDAELVCLYQRALALIMPSLCEGFGLPVLESMAAGTPVIHSTHPALLEVAGGNGLAVPATNVDKLIVALRTIAESEAKRHDLSAAGLRHAQHYTWARWGRQAATLLQTRYG